MWKWFNFVSPVLGSVSGALNFVAKASVKNPKTNAVVTSTGVLAVLYEYFPSVMNSFGGLIVKMGHLISG
jgi:gamma-glutamyl phosphate reductase